MNKKTKIIVTLTGLTFLVGLGVVIWGGPAKGLAQLISPLRVSSSDASPTQSPLQSSTAEETPSADKLAPLPPAPTPTPRITPTPPMTPKEISAYDPHVPLQAGSVTLGAEHPFNVEQPIIFRAWSPNGEEFLFGRSFQDYILVRLRDGVGSHVSFSDLWVADTNGSHQRKLADLTSNWVWSPDGQSVAYLTPVKGEGIEGSLYVVDIEHPKPRKIAKCDLARTQDLAWLPTDEIVCRQNGVMYAIESDSGEKRHLNDIFSSEPVPGPTNEMLPPIFQGYYRISPDGERIAYIKTGIPPILWVSSLDGTRASQVGIQPYVSTDVVAWSPDSSRFAYSIYNDNNPPGADLWIVDANGANLDCIVAGGRESAQSIEPTWSPDGRVIAYTYRANRPSEPESVWIVSTDGTEPHLLVDLASVPRWSPRGNEIAVLRQSVIFDKPESLLLSLSLDQ